MMIILNLILYILFTFQLSQLYGYQCEVNKVCDDCVKAFPHCHWCSSDDYKDVRCKPVSQNFTGCSNVENPKGSINIESRSFSSDPTKITQIRPQAISITTKVEQTHEFDIYFKAAEDYPADLYFLIDASNSMSKVMKAIGSASENIYSEMQSITKNVLLGMGTFIDKNTAPFVHARDPSVNAYSFRHGISMTSDFETFKNTIYNTPSGTNYDEPEGGFDALAQVMACKAEIGWREESRKIIFYITDNLYHSAGDGKWAGIVLPYDGQCYTVNKIYTKELDMDYPSIAILNKLSIDEEMTIIFIVIQSKVNAYESLVKINERWKVLSYHVDKDVIKFEKSQIQELVSSIYEEISHNIKLKLSIPPEIKNDIKFEFSPDCYKGKNKQECVVKKGVEKHFKGKVTLLQHLRQDKVSVNLKIQGIKENLVLNLKKANCECSKKAVPKSPFCNRPGTKKCGVCECDSSRTGKKCECPANTIDEGDQATCKPISSTLLCNGFGACICGACKCDDGREGEYCECDINSCPKMCSGNGICQCGNCKCNRGWTGDACDCREKPCKQAHNKTCNGRGECECGECKCQQPASWDAREIQTDACEITPCNTCHNTQCLKLKECALCHIDNAPNKCKEFCHTSIRVDKVESLDNATDVNVFKCDNVQADFGCYTRFQYTYDDINYGVQIWVSSQKDCLETYYWLGGGSLLSLLLIGLLTLIAWKVLTDLRDRREYERFLKSTNDSNDAICQNPIYAPATTLFSNPAFRRPSIDNTL